MRKIGSSSLMIGASVVAVTAGILVACAHDKSGQVADASAAIPDRPDWNWDVRPILSQNCFACHGQGTQKAGLRLDIQKAAYDPIPEDKNKRAIVPGNPGRSELFHRITSSDADFRMQARQCGGKDYVVKPFDFIEIPVKALTYVLQNRLEKSKATQPPVAAPSP